MIVNVGSKNPVKIEAVRSALSSYEFFKDAEFRGTEVSVPLTEIPEQPCGHKETQEGAKFRAINAFRDCDYSVGLEAGLANLELLGETFPRLNSTFCAIYDGSNIYVGHSGGFLIPRRVAEIIQTERLQLDQAWKRAGLTEKQRIGYGEGIIHGLTRGRLNRQHYIEQAINMAMVHFMNKDLFSEQ